MEPHPPASDSPIAAAVDMQLISFYFTTTTAVVVQKCLITCRKDARCAIVVSLLSVRMLYLVYIIYRHIFQYMIIYTGWLPTLKLHHQN